MKAKSFYFIFFNVFNFIIENISNISNYPYIGFLQIHGKTWHVLATFAGLTYDTPEVELLGMPIIKMKIQIKDTAN